MTDLYVGYPGNGLQITSGGMSFPYGSECGCREGVVSGLRERDFMIGAYFSKPDWNSPYYWSDRWQHGDRNVNYKIKEHPWMWEKFCDFTYNQVKELMTGYGNIDIIWLDGGWAAPGMGTGY
ncbi:MAG: alpha-L-fucosidase [Butyricimonas faecihominis]